MQFFQCGPIGFRYPALKQKPAATRELNTGSARVQVGSGEPGTPPPPIAVRTLTSLLYGASAGEQTGSSRASFFSAPPELIQTHHLTGVGDGAAAAAPPAVSIHQLADLLGLLLDWNPVLVQVPKMILGLFLVQPQLKR